MGQHQTNQHLHHRFPRNRRENGTEILFEAIIAKNFPNQGKETDIQMQESQSSK